MSETPKPNIFQRLRAVMEEVPYIKKDKDVSTGGEGSYKAVTHDQVAGIVRGPFVKNGIGVITEVVEQKSVETGAKTAKGAAHIRVEGVYRISFVNVDEPTDRSVHTVLAHAIDSGDKAPGKALSYALKGAVLKALFIETGVNDESRYGEDDGELDTDKQVEIEKALRESPTRDVLAKRLEKALHVAEEAGDKLARKRFIAIGNELVAKLPNVQTPQAKAPEGGGDEQKAPDKKAPPASADKASKGMVDSIVKLGGTKGYSEEDLVAIANEDGAGIAAVADFSKADGAAFLKKVGKLEAKA